MLACRVTVRRQAYAAGGEDRTLSNGSRPCGRQQARVVHLTKIGRRLRMLAPAWVHPEGHRTGETTRRNAC